jgi:hypothetical protein
MENMREDLIRECSAISARKVESLLTEDKIIKIMAWNITKVNKREPTEKERDTQINTLLKEFTNVFSKELHPPSNCGTHNFYIHTIAGAKPQI